MPNRHRVRGEDAGGASGGRQGPPAHPDRDRAEPAPRGRRLARGGLRRRLGHDPRAALPLVPPGPRGRWTPTAQTSPFAYYFCQREAIETLIYLYEVRGLRTLSGLTAEFGGADAETRRARDQPRRGPLGPLRLQDRDRRRQDQGHEPRDRLELLPRAARAGLDAGSRLRDHRAEHHRLRAPQGGLQAGGGRPDIFDTDPLIPPAWRGDWNCLGRASGRAERRVDRRHDLPDEHPPPLRPSQAAQVQRAEDVRLDGAEGLQGEGARSGRGAARADHRPQAPDGSQRRGAPRLGPGLGLERGDRVPARRDRRSAAAASSRSSTSPPRRRTTRAKSSGTSSATRRSARPSTAASSRRRSSATARSSSNGPTTMPRYKYENHLTLGYKRWQSSSRSGRRAARRPLLFVMTESTEAADQIAHRLNTDPHLQGPQRQDDQPAHEPQGQAQEARQGRDGVLRVRREPRSRSATRTSRRCGSSPASWTAARARTSASSRC